MIPYTAIDLVALIRLEMEEAAAKRRIPTTTSLGLFHQLRQRLAMGRPATR